MTQPHVRSDLLLYLSELSVDNPRRLWNAERESGKVAGIDEVFHFFFDDHDFDHGAIGITLLNENEVRLVGAVKDALEAILVEVGDAGDDDFVLHAVWPEVRSAAALAKCEIARTPVSSFPPISALSDHQGQIC